MTCVVQSNNDLSYKSLHRIHNYPIVNDSLVLALSYYQWLKSTNVIIDNTLTKAEKTLKTVKETAEPIAAKKLRYIDSIVYNQLERLERTCPVILESSKAIADKSSRVYRDNLQSTVKTIMWPVNKTIDSVSKTSNVAFSTVSSVVDLSIEKVLPTNYLSESPSNYVINKTDAFLDRFLPESIDESDNEELNSSSVYLKVKRLSAKTQTRIYRKACKQIDLLQKSSLEKLEHIHYVITEIQSKKRELQANMMQEYSQVIESIKESIPIIPLEHLKLMKEILHCSKDLLKSLSISSTLTIEFMVKNALHASISLNDSLLNLQNMLIKANPEFISDSTLEYTKNMIVLIRAWLDFFINLFKIINLIGVKPLLAII